MSETNLPLLRDLPDQILGSRVLLRPYRPGDGKALWEAIEESRDHIVPWLSWGDSHRSLEDSEAFVRKSQTRWLLREELPISIWERATGRFLGGSGLRCEWEIPAFEIGYWLRRSAEGQGYMTEAVRLLSHLAFETLGANRVCIFVATGNLRSATIPRRLGFIQEGILRNFKRDTTGTLYDMQVFAMTPEEYAASRDTR